MNRNSLIAALFVAPVLAGCAQTEWEGVTYVDEHFSPAEEAAIQRAADMWDKATGGAVHFNLALGEHLLSNPTSAIVRADTSNLPPVLADADAYGSTDYYTHTIVIAPEACGAADPAIYFAHELGHSAGLIHIANEPAAMMDPDLAPGKCITRADIAMACKVNHHDCTGRTLKPCN